MSLLPNIIHQNNQKNTIRFSNPLTGIIFDNHSFLKKSHIEVYDNPPTNSKRNKSVYRQF